MSFDLTAEQAILRDSLSACLARHWDQARHNKGGIEARRRLWDDVVRELGLTGVTIPEAQGGLGGGRVDMMVIARELGRALALEGFVPTVVCGGALFARTGDDRRLAALAAGDLHLALAHVEPGQRPDARAVASRVAEGRLTGTKVMVAGAPLATHFIVSANEPGQDAFSLFLVPAGSPGIRRRDFNQIDGQPASELTFTDVAIAEDDRIGDAGQGPDLHRAAADEAVIARAGEGIGMMEVLIRTTADYLGQRQQFGQPLATFQALQHRMADMLLQLEDTRSMLHMALSADDTDPAAFQQAVSGLKITSSEALRFVSQQAVQLHGGMGITDELMVSHYFKRAMVIIASDGGPDFHRKRYEASLG
ncbi:acyl-CoA dehydrogenase family protein [Tistrella mobilis]|uniref:acyl-CoA dehydrogenase family protein n=1 Tax=Tistrella mobilis TaxID=171437 RepID=UPI000C099801|nr:pimeloyl-CoA dehydrogenase small subunit [Tistrella sp.]